MRHTVHHMPKVQLHVWVDLLNDAEELVTMFGIVGIPVDSGSPTAISVEFSPCSDDEIPLKHDSNPKSAKIKASCLGVTSSMARDQKELLQEPNHWLSLSNQDDQVAKFGDASHQGGVLHKAHSLSMLVDTPKDATDE